MDNPQEAEEETLLISLLDYHPLAIEDCQTGKEEEGHLPKVEDYDDYLLLFLILWNLLQSVSPSPCYGYSNVISGCKH